jgi:HlyD family secretion protein
MRIAAFRAAGVASSVAVLVQGVLRAMLIQKLRTAAIVLAASMGLLAASFILVSALPAPALSRQEPQRKSDTPEGKRPVAAPATKDSPVPEVAVVSIKKESFDRTTNRIGNVEAFRIVKVGAKVSGTLARVVVDIGSHVKKGEVLAEVDAPELELEVLRADAMAEHARARTESAKSQVTIAEAALMSAMAKLDSAKSATKSAESQVEYRAKTFARIQQLANAGSVEQRLLDEEADRLQAAKVAVQSAALQVRIADAGVVEARAKLANTKASIAELHEAQKLADIDRQKAAMIRNSARIVSPIDGIVISRNCTTGEFVRLTAAGGSNPLFTVVNTETVRIVTSVSDSEVPLVDLGDPATFTANAYPRQVFKGKVARIAESEDATQTMRVELDLPNPDGKLRTGMSGVVQIRLESVLDTITLPNPAIGQAGDGSFYCFKVVDGRAVRTAISLDGGWKDGCIIGSGLKPGDLVVADCRGLNDGQTIRPKPELPVKTSGGRGLQ